MVVHIVAPMKRLYWEYVIDCKPFLTVIFSRFYTDRLWLYNIYNTAASRRTMVIKAYCGRRAGLHKAVVIVY